MLFCLIIITDHIHEFFNAIDNVFQDVEASAYGEDENDPDAGNGGGNGEQSEEEGQADQASDTSDAEIETLAPDQQENLAQDTNPVDEVMPQVEEAVQEYNPRSTSSGC